MASDTVLLEREGKAAILTLNRPDKHNALNGEMIAALTGALDTVNADESIRSVILRANGKSFCAGADLHWMRQSIDYNFDDNYQDAYQLASCLQRLNTLNKPVIAEVKGNVFGGGVGLVACCDIVICHPEAKFCLSEVKLGLIPAVISPFVIDAIGERNARRYFVTAEVFQGAKAKAMGLAHEVTDELSTEAEKLAKAINSNAPVAVSLSKKLIADVAHKPRDEELLKLTSERIAKVRVSEEAQSGIKAFFEGR